MTSLSRGRCAFDTSVAGHPAGYSLHPFPCTTPQTAETSATKGDRHAWDARALKEERRYGAPLRVGLWAIGEGERGDCVFFWRVCTPY